MRALDCLNLQCEVGMSLSGFRHLYALGQSCFRISSGKGLMTSLWADASFVMTATR